MSFGPNAYGRSRGDGQRRSRVARSALVDLIYQHYDELDSRYKGIIPLNQVYVPESVEPATG